MAAIRRKLQVFVSSTYLDLQLERQAAVQAILRAGHIPAGMELFASGDEGQMRVIQRWIDESDVYMLILGTRYGSIDKIADKSYTQLEYEYAVQINKPLFSCVIDESAIDSRFRLMGKNAGDNNGEKLQFFRANVLSRMSRFWSDEKDIALTIFQSLSDLERQESLVGWVRGDQALNPIATERMAQEIARLSAENNGFREQLSNNRIGPVFSGLTYEEVKRRLQKLNLLNKFCELRTMTVIDVNEALGEFESHSAGHELFLLGLAETSSNYPYNRISDSGFAFLNMYVIEQDNNG